MSDRHRLTGLISMAFLPALLHVLTDQNSLSNQERNCRENHLHIKRYYPNKENQHKQQSDAAHAEIDGKPSFAISKRSKQQNDLPYKRNQRKWMQGAHRIAEELL
jgi:hypothetical protein